MPKKYPPLTPSEVIAILKANGFEEARQEGSHFHYVGMVGGKSRLVTVDEHIKEFGVTLMQSMIRQ